MGLRTYFGYIEGHGNDDGEPKVRLDDHAFRFTDCRQFLNAFADAASAAGVKRFEVPSEIQTSLEDDGASLSGTASTPGFG